METISCNSNSHLYDRVETSTSSYDEEIFATVETSPPKRRAGRKKFRETRHPVYRGVRRRNAGKWVCEVREPNKKSRIWLGTFPTPEMAARAHDVAAMALRGRSACLNFADSAWLLPLPASSNAKDIQKAAAEAAEAFRPSMSDSNSGSDVEPESLTLSPEIESNFYMEDFGFDMDMDMSLLSNMAEGVLLSPPHSPSGFHWDDVECDADVFLWSYSIPTN